MTSRITGLRKPSEISEKGLDLFSIYTLLHNATTVHVHELQLRLVIMLKLLPIMLFFYALLPIMPLYS